MAMWTLVTITGSIVLCGTMISDPRGNQGAAGAFFSQTAQRTDSSTDLQEEGQTENPMDGKPRVSSATQTESNFGQHEGKLSSPDLSDMSGLSVTGPTLPEHGTGSPAQSMPADVQQPLYKEPSFAVTAGQDLYHSPLPSDASKACKASPAAQRSSDQEIAMPAAAQAQAIAIPVQSGRTPSQSRRGSYEQPSSWTRAGVPAPASPFATAEDDDFTFSGSRATEGDTGRLELPGFSSASTQPGTSPGQDSLFALRQRESSASQQEQRNSSRLADGAAGRARRSLESADSAYTAMHAQRQQNEQLALRGGAAAAARPDAASDPGKSAAHDLPQHEASSEGHSDLMPGYSQASSMTASPVVGRPVRCTPLQCLGYPSFL